MLKHILSIAALLACSLAATAQRVYPLVTAADIQTVSATNLAACNDAPARVGDTVRIRGIVITRGGIAITASGRQIFIRDIAGSGPFQAIGLRFGGGNTATTPNDILNLVAGDTVEITGPVVEFNGGGANPALDGETQINPLVNGVRVIGDGIGPAPTPTLLPNVGILNNATRVNNLPTGEQWEGNFIEIQNTTVVAVNNFTAGTPPEARVSFTVADAAGNRVEISDRFSSARPANGFVAPQIGDQFTSIKGVIIHNKNGCTGTGPNNRGYTINPFDPTHYVRGASSPAIGSIARAVISPCSTDIVTISATITDDGSITSAKLLYAIGEGTTTYTSVDMTPGGSDSFTANIPAAAEGTLVKYYIRAIDNSNNTTNTPNILTLTPIFYIVRCGAPQIRDLQYTPFVSGESGYKGLTVTDIEGVVTSSAAPTNLGQVYIQQTGATAWGGMWLTGGAAISSLSIGDKVKVSGLVQENFGMTRISVSSATLVSSGNAVTTVNVAPAVLSAYDFAANEAYEGMLVRVAAATGNLFVVDTNVLAATAPPTANNAEYRLGNDQFDPNTGVVIQAGRQTGTSFSSLNVSYVNNRKWAILDGTMNVPAIVLGLGDQFTSATGIVYFGFNIVKVLPRTTDDMAGFISGTKPTAARAAGYSIAPNPASGTLHILASKLGNARYSILAVDGRKVSVAGQITNSKTAVDVSGLAPGIYTMLISNGVAAFSERIVIQ